MITHCTEHKVFTVKDLFWCIMCNAYSSSSSSLFVMARDFVSKLNKLHLYTYCIQHEQLINVKTRNVNLNNVNSIYLIRFGNGNRNENNNNNKGKRRIINVHMQHIFIRTIRMASIVINCDCYKLVFVQNHI